MRDDLALPIDHFVRTHVASVEFACGVDAPDAAGSFAMFGILSGGDIDLVVVQHGKGDQVIARATATQFQHAVFGVRIEFP